MINAIETAIEAVRKAAREQSESIVRELNADFDARNVALGTYNDAMRQVKALREQADDIERTAHDTLNSALTSSGGVALAMINQINQGQIVASIDTPSPRKRRAIDATSVEEGDNAK